jgi:two-component system, chemotaxis family, chemotaxis protein CheY
MKKLLIIDDMESIRSVLAAQARESGFAVEQASNGELALTMCGNNNYDAIFCDWNMPVMNGEEFIRQLRTTGSRVPVIMVTAETDRNKVLALAQLGISGYIMKPFKLDAVQAVLERLKAS